MKKSNHRVRCFFLRFPFIVLSGMLLMLPGVFLHAQTNPGFTLSVSVQPARCQSDGVISCTLSDTAGMHLEQVKFYYSSYSGHDSISETSLPVISDLSPGTYKVKVTAVMPTSLSQGESYVIVSDSVEGVEVATTYEVPASGLIYSLYTFGEPMGIVPSFACTPTGKFQVKIEKGVFPYTVQVYRKEGGDTVLFRTMVFDSRMYSGEEEWRYDYKDYYSVEDMAAGDYLVVCHDGCGYYMPMMAITVPEAVVFPVNNYLIRNSPVSFSDSNVFCFKTLLNENLLSEAVRCNDDYYRDMRNGEYAYEYRFENPVYGGDGKSYTPWRRFPVVAESDGLLLYDTVPFIQNYGDMWGQEIVLQVRPRYCPEEIYDYTYSIRTPVSTRRIIYTHVTSSVWWLPYYDECGFHDDTYIRHGYKGRYDFYVAEDAYGCGKTVEDKLRCRLKSWYSLPEEGTLQDYKTNTHYYYTLPYRCRIFNLSADTVVSSGIPFTMGPLFFRYIVPLSLDGDSLLFEFYDGKGVNYASRLECPDLSPLVESRFPYSIVRWECGQYDYESEKEGAKFKDYCSHRKRGIKFLQHAGSDSHYGHRSVPSYRYDTIRVIESPEGNRYNFTAVYSPDDGWVFVEKDLSNTATLRSTQRHDDALYCPSVVYEDYDMPSGRYRTSCYTHCKSKWDTFVVDACFKDPPVLEQKPEYRFIKECSVTRVVPVAGRLSLACNSISEPYFRVRRPAAPADYASACTLFDTLSVGTDGDYVLSMYAYPQNDVKQLDDNPCFVFDTVVTIRGGSFGLDYSCAYVCGPGDSVGFVRAKGKDGKRPYHYMLYDGPDGSGRMVAENDNGVFENVAARFGKEMSVRISDSCGAYFVSNLKVRDMEHTRKCWAESRLNDLSLCEGSTAHFYGLSLGDVTYHWTGPGGFAADGPQVELTVPRGGKVAGYYCLAIEGSGCPALRDSVRLSVLAAPKVTITGDTAVCPGREANVVLKAEGFGTVGYNVLRSDGLHSDTLHFADRADGSCDTLHDSISFQPTRYSVLSVRDSRCSYRFPEDTVEVALRRQPPRLALSADNDDLCPGETAVMKVRAEGASSYQVHWYADSALGRRLRTDDIDGGQTAAVYAVPALTADTTLYAVAFAKTGCPYYPQAVYGMERMHEGGRRLDVGEDVLFFDSGGPEGGYASCENSRFTFRAADGHTPFQIRFDYFIGNDSLPDDTTDCLYLFDGDTAGGRPDYVVRGLHGRGDSLRFVARSGSLTCWFVSGYHPEAGVSRRPYAGWQARVGALPSAEVAASVSAAVNPGVPVEVVCRSSAAKDTLLAVVPEDVPCLYRWERSPDGTAWVSVGDGGPRLVVDHTPARDLHYRVAAADMRYILCPAVSKPVRLDAVRFVNLSLEYLPFPDTVCPGAADAVLRLRNEGTLPAEEVRVIQRRQTAGGLPAYDTAVVSAVAAGATEEIVFPLTVGHEDAGLTVELKAQIDDCRQTNFPETVVFGDWDWKGWPRQADEDGKSFRAGTEPERSFDTTLYVNDVFVYKDSSYKPVSTGSKTLRWYFHNAGGCDSLLVVHLQIRPWYAPCQAAVDYEGHAYPSVRIGQLCWLRENLHSRYYSDGRPVDAPMVYNANGHRDVAFNERVFGLLYSLPDAIDSAGGEAAHYGVSGTSAAGAADGTDAADGEGNGRIRGICPSGWFLPTEADYEELLQYGTRALRSPEYWIAGSGDNSTGFTALPSGYYSGRNRSFEGLYAEARYWSSDCINREYATVLGIDYYCGDGRLLHGLAGNGYSIRCVRP